MVMDRKCTDVFMCLIFFLFFCGMFATAAYGYKNGNPSNLVTTFDSDGNVCGKGNLTGYNYLFWPDLASAFLNASQNTSSITLSPTMLGDTICVKSCPLALANYTCYTNSKFKTCPTNYMDTKGCK